MTNVRFASLFKSACVVFFYLKLLISLGSQEKKKKRLYVSTSGWLYVSQPVTYNEFLLQVHSNGRDEFLDEAVVNITDRERRFS